MQRLTLIFDLPDELAAYLDGDPDDRGAGIADALLGDELPAFERDRAVDLRQILAGIGVPLVMLPDHRVDATLRYVDATLAPVEPAAEAPEPVLAPDAARLVLADLRTAALLRHATYVDDRLREALDLLAAVAVAERPSVDLLDRIRDFAARLRRQDRGVRRAAETTTERRLLAEVLLVAEEEWAGVESAPEVIAEARQYLDAIEAAGTVLP